MKHSRLVGWLLSALLLTTSLAAAQQRPGLDAKKPKTLKLVGLRQVPCPPVGPLVWAATAVGAGTMSTAWGPNTLRLANPLTGTTCYRLMGAPVRGITLFPSPHVVVTNRPSLFWIGGNRAQEALLSGRANRAPIFAAAFSCFGKVCEVYAVTDSTYHILVAGTVNAFDLPGRPRRAGIVSQNAAALMTCEAVVQCDDDLTMPGVVLWTQLGGVNLSTPIATDPVAMTEMFMVPDTGGGGLRACAAAAVFELTLVTIVQAGKATQVPLAGMYTNHVPSAGGITVILLGGGNQFIPLACPAGVVPANMALGGGGNMSFLAAPGSVGRNMAAPPPLVIWGC